MRPEILQTLVLRAWKSLLVLLEALEDRLVPAINAFIWIDNPAAVPTGAQPAPASPPAAGQGHPLRNAGGLQRGGGDRSPFHVQQGRGAYRIGVLQFLKGGNVRRPRRRLAPAPGHLPQGGHTCPPSTARPPRT